MRAMLLVLLLCGSAAADAGQAPCWVAGGFEVHPADGAVDVPINAAVWVAGGAGGYLLDGAPVESRLLSPVRIERLELGGLHAREEYVVEQRGTHLTRFTTGRRVDLEPPEPPVIERVAAATDTERDQIELALAPSPDTVALAITVRGERPGSGSAMLYATRTGLAGTAPSGCTGFTLPPAARVCFEIRAIDVSDNRSAPVETCTRVVDQRPVPGAARGEHREAAPPVRPSAFPMGLWAIAVLGWFGGLLVLARRARARRGAGPQIDAHRGAVSALAARHRNIGFSLALAGLAGVIALEQLAVTELTLEARLWLVGLIAVVSVTAGTMGGLAHRVSRLALRRDVRVTTDGRYALLRRGDKLVGWMRVRPAALARMASRYVPMAIARRRD